MGGGMSGDGVDGGKQDAGDGGKGSPAQGRSYSQAEVDALVAGKLEGFVSVLLDWSPVFSWVLASASPSESCLS